jgi:hypothetical protein
MHLTSHAIKLTIASLALFLAFSYGAGQSAQQTLDLTGQTRVAGRPMGVPGGSARGAGGETIKRGYDLPLRLDVKQLQVSERSVALRLVLANVGQIPIDIPSCADGHKAFPPGATGRLTLNFGLAFQASGREIDQIVDVTFGSASEFSCSIVLEPGHSLFVIDDVPIPRDALREGAASVKAFVEEWRIENERYFVQAYSQRVESESIRMPNGK